MPVPSGVSSRGRSRRGETLIEGIGTFPERGAPRVVWAGVGEGRAAVVELAHAVTERLGPAGVPREARPFSPHLTLGRVREAAGLRAAVLLDGLAEARFGTTQVEAITLFESRLSPQGPPYVALQRTALRGA